ncbi:MAG: hypothetical protein IH624_16995 [Phycisphaerae bacterium]|nr:hypothetical protein [Phycisphaerae bacterium]
MNTNDQKAILGSPAQPSAVEPMESICSKPGLPWLTSASDRTISVHVLANGRFCGMLEPLL